MLKHLKKYRLRSLKGKKRPWVRAGLAGAVLFLLISCVNKVAWGGPWTQPKGSLYVNYSAISTTREKLKTFNNTRANIGKVKTLSHTTLIRYGLLDNLDIYTQIPYELASLKGDPSSTVRSFSDGRFGFQYCLLKEKRDAPVSVALAFEYKKPLSNYPVDKFSSLGEHQEDYEYRFLLGRYFDAFNRKSYFNIEGGYRARSGAPSDEVFGFGEVGMLFVPKLSGRVFVYGVDALGGIGADNDPQFQDILSREGAPPFRFVGENYVKTGVGLTFYPTDSIDVGVFWIIPAYRTNTTLDRHIGISIGYKF